MTALFNNRSHAGLLLAERLADLQLVDPVVLALPRGGVPVAVQVARRLLAPLDLVLVRKIGVPWQPELAVAAVVDGSQPELVIDEEVRRSTGVSRAYIEAEAKRQWAEIVRRRAVYLKGRTSVGVRSKTVILVDDGLATGTTARAALKALRRHGPARLVLAVPLAPSETARALRTEVDQLVCLAEPQPFHSMSQHYEDFHQVGDDEVLAALASLADLPTISAAAVVLHTVTERAASDRRRVQRRVVERALEHAVTRD